MLVVVVAFFFCPKYKRGCLFTVSSPFYYSSLYVVRRVSTVIIFKSLLEEKGGLARGYNSNPLLILVQGPKINENENEIYENKEIISFFSR